MTSCIRLAAAWQTKTSHNHLPMLEASAFLPSRGHFADFSVMQNDLQYTVRWRPTFEVQILSLLAFPCALEEACR